MQSRKLNWFVLQWKQSQSQQDADHRAGRQAAWQAPPALVGCNSPQLTSNKSLFLSSVCLHKVETSISCCVFFFLNSHLEMVLILVFSSSPLNTQQSNPSQSNSPVSQLLSQAPSPKVRTCISQAVQQLVCPLNFCTFITNNDKNSMEHLTEVTDPLFLSLPISEFPRQKPI